MEGADVSTELWLHPVDSLFLTSFLCFESTLNNFSIKIAADWIQTLLPTLMSERSQLRHNRGPIWQEIKIIIVLIILQWS